MVWSSPRRSDEDCRAQTLQDYVLGVSLFLSVVLAVVGFTVPSVIAPFGSDASTAQTNQADRISGRIVSNASFEEAPNRLDVATMQGIVALDTAALRTRYNVPRTTSVNISVRTLDGDSVVNDSSGTRLGTSQPLDADRAVTSTRIVTLSDDSCTPACRLVVGVW